jgi:lipopolysaccharide transport system permease protein
MLTALGVSLWLTALSVRYRDVSFALPFLISLWMFITPVVFAVEKIPSSYQLLLWLNPMTGVIEGFRWSLLGLAPPDWSLMGLSLGIVAVILISGGIYFRTMERTFADVI